MPLTGVAGLAQDGVISSAELIARIEAILPAIPGTPWGAVLMQFEGLGFCGHGEAPVSGQEQRRPRPDDGGAG